MTNDPDVVVVGGGLAGLAAATIVARAGRSVVLLDRHPLGGRARGEVRDGYHFDRGPRALYRGGAAERVLDALGVTDRPGGRPPSDRGTGLCADALGVLPAGPVGLVRTRLVPIREKPAFARAFARLPRLDPGRFAGQSADQVIDSLGLGPIGADTLRGLVRVATYCASTDVLDGPTAVEQIQMAIGAGVTYLDGGWQRLVDQLAERARAARAVLRRAGVRRVTPGADQPVAVTLDDGSVIRPTSVVIAAGRPPAAAGLLGAAWPELGPPATVACLELGLRRVPSTRFVLGIDEPLYLSCHHPPADLAPPGGSVVHLMRYLHPADATPTAHNQARLRRLARQAGIDDADIVTERFLARLEVTGAIPTAARGTAGRVPVADPTRPGVYLAGDWVGGDGLLSDAALASAEVAAQRAPARAATMVAG